VYEPHPLQNDVLAEWLTAYVHHAPDRLAVIEAFVEDAVALANNESPVEPTDGRPPLKKEVVPLAYRVRCSGRCAQL